MKGAVGDPSQVENQWFYIGSKQAYVTPDLPSGSPGAGKTYSTHDLSSTHPFYSRRPQGTRYDRWDG